MLNKIKEYIEIFLIKFFYIATIVLLYSTIANAYTPPLGIPRPFIDPYISRPETPANWDHEIPGYYYIDYEKGTDSERTYGYPDAPRQTIPRPIPPGSFILIHGKYDFAVGGVIHFEGYGTNDSWEPNISGPIWIVGDDSETSFIGPSKTIIYGKYIFVENVKFARCQIGSPSNGFKAEYILIRNCTMEGDSKSRWCGINIVGSYDAQVSNIIVFKNVVYNYGDINTSEDQDAEGIFVQEYTHYVWILNNKVYNCSGSGIGAGGQYGKDPDIVHHIFIGRNEVFQVRQSGIWLKNGKDVIFSQNYVHDIIDTPWSPSKGLGAQYGPIRLWILFNRVERVRYGVRIASTDADKNGEIAIIGNIISDAHHISGEYQGGSWDEAGIHIVGGDTVYLINNTLYKCDAGINISSSHTYYIINNIISNVTEKAGNHIYVENAPDSTFINNCILFQPNEDFKIKWGSKIYNGAQDDIDNKIKNISGVNPLLESDLSLKVASPAIDFGINPKELGVNVFDQFLSLYGIDICVDFNGTRRPQGNAWDVGAYEFNKDNANDSSPTPPKNLHIKVIN